MLQVGAQIIEKCLDIELCVTNQKHFCMNIDIDLLKFSKYLWKTL